MKQDKKEDKNGPRNGLWTIARRLNWLECCPVPQKHATSDQGAHLDFGCDPWQRHGWEAACRCFSPTLMLMFHSIPPSNLSESINMSSSEDRKMKTRPLKYARLLRTELRDCRSTLWPRSIRAVIVPLCNNSCSSLQSPGWVIWQKGHQTKAQMTCQMILAWGDRKEAEAHSSSPLRIPERWGSLWTSELDSTGCVLPNPKALITFSREPHPR